MNQQSVQPPIARDSITLTLSPAEQDALVRCLHVASLNQLTIMDACYLINLNNKLKFLTESGDACRHPAQSPDVVEQDGTLISNPDEKIKARTFGLRCRFCQYIYDDAPGCDGCSFNYSFRSSDAAGQGGSND